VDRPFFFFGAFVFPAGEPASKKVWEWGRLGMMMMMMTMMAEWGKEQTESCAGFGDEMFLL
jgi:hypothetical protein